MRRERLSRGRAVLVVLVAGALLFASTLPTWVSGEARTTTGAEPVVVDGVTAAPGVASAAAVVLVAALVLGLSGRVTRLLAVVGVLLGGVLALVGAVAFLTDPLTPLLSAAAEVGGVPELAGEASTAPWPVVTAVLAAVVTALGAAMPWLLGSWQRVGRRYERDTAPREGREAAAAAPEAGPTGEVAGRVRAMDDWDALTRGEDPSQHGGR